MRQYNLGGSAAAWLILRAPSAFRQEASLSGQGWYIAELFQGPAAGFVVSLWIFRPGGMQLVKNVEIAWKEVEGQKAQMATQLHLIHMLAFTRQHKFHIAHMRWPGCAAQSGTSLGWQCRFSDNSVLQSSARFSDAATSNGSASYIIRCRVEENLVVP